MIGLKMEKKKKQKKNKGKKLKFKKKSRYLEEIRFFFIVMM